MKLIGNVPQRGIALKTYVDVQQKIIFLQDYLSKLNRELELSKPRETIDPTAMYERIDRLAKKYAIVNKRLRNSNNVTKKSYLQLLAMMVNFEQEELEHKLLFLQRIAAGSEYESTAEDLLRNGRVVDSNSFEDALEHVYEHKHSLLLDFLLTANIVRPASETELNFIAELASLLKLDLLQVTFVAQFAKCLLQQDEDSFVQNIWPNAGKWFGSITHHLPESWLTAHLLINQNEEYEQ